MLKLVGNYGFPMVIALYVLIRLEPAIKGLQKTITILTIVVAKSNNVDYEEARKFVGSGGDY
ncbi:MAG: YvrJ family protein [Bacillota bacterium]|nr:YvrJ family protein [Bacillota bacterium]